jgi:excisionase family DNA binding protein
VSSTTKQTTRAPTLALSVEEACAALGVSWDFWNEHVASEIRIVRLGRRKLIAVTELQRFLDEHGEHVLEDAA